jgi:hypothetical protein
MTSRRIIVRRLILGVAFLAILVLPAASMFLCLVIADPFGGSAHPTDSAMLQKQRATLDELVRMIAEDAKLVRLAPEFTRPEDPGATGVSAERIAAYRRLCAETGIAHGFSHYGDAIEFIVHTQGLSISGSAKGFIYAANAADDAMVVDGDLDAAAASLYDKDVRLERKIDDNWWLILDMR